MENQMPIGQTVGSPPQPPPRHSGGNEGLQNTSYSTPPSDQTSDKVRWVIVIALIFVIILGVGGIFLLMSKSDEEGVPETETVSQEVEVKTSSLLVEISADSDTPASFLAKKESLARSYLNKEYPGERLILQVVSTSICIKTEDLEITPHETIYEEFVDLILLDQLQKGEISQEEYLEIVFSEEKRKVEHRNLAPLFCDSYIFGYLNTDTLRLQGYFVFVSKTKK